MMYLFGSLLQVVALAGAIGLSLYDKTIDATYLLSFVVYMEIMLLRLDIKKWLGK